MSTILRRLDASAKTHATNARACETYARALATYERVRANLKNSDRKMVKSARVPNLKGALHSRLCPNRSALINKNWPGH